MTRLGYDSRTDWQNAPQVEWVTDFSQEREWLGIKLFLAHAKP
jgi:hypothetical protein